MKLRAVVIGAGNMGFFHAKQYEAREDVDLVGVVEKDEEKGKRVAEECKCLFYPSVEQLLSEQQIDMASIATPTTTHAEIGLLLLQKGIHVLVEKPIATTIREAEELISCAKQQGKVLLVGHVERFNPAVKKVAELIAEGEIGEIVSITVRRVGVAPPPVKGADVVLDLAIHDIDIINFLVGKKVKTVESFGITCFEGNELDGANILLDYGTCSGTIETNWVTPRKSRLLRVTGKKGYIFVNYITQEVELFKRAEYPESLSYQDMVNLLSKEEPINVQVTKSQPLAEEIDHFVKSVQGKEQGMDPEEAQYAMSIAIEASEKARRHDERNRY